MPRPVRVHLDGAISYVTSRAMEGLVLFRDQKDYEAYRTIVLEYKAQYGFKLFAAVLLPGELHLAIEPSQAASISTIMHAVTSRYTKHYGKRYGHTGHLFQSRFKLALLEKAPSLLRLTGYLHALPQRCGAADDVEAYRWSSIGDYMSGARHPAQPGQDGGVSGTGIVPRPGWCSGDEVVEVLGQLHAARPGWTYALHFRSLSVEDFDRCEREFQRPVVGSESFQAAVEQKRKESAKPAEAPAASLPVVRALHGRIPSMALTVATAVGLALVITMALSLRTISSLKDTIGVLAMENQQTVGVLLDQLAKTTGIRLASYARSQTLNGTSWDIQLKPTFGAASSIEATDTLAFDRSGNRVTSGQLLQAGFPDAPFTAKRQDGGTVLWETFQVGPDGETVSWRGEWKGSMMRGVMARQQPGRPDETFRFIGIPHSGAREI